MTIKGTSLYQGHQIRIPVVVLLGVVGLFCALYVAVNLRTDKLAHLAISLVFFCATGSSLWDQRPHLQRGSNLLSIGLGSSLILGMLYQSFQPPTGLYLGFSPLIAALGIILLASGGQALGQYKTELFTLFCLGVPKLLLKVLPDISPLTAQFSTYLLWYSGFTVHLTDTLIQLPNGGVNVVPSCSGLNLISYMLAITLIFLLMFPLPTSARIYAPLVAVTLGFVVNGIRVALLALLSTQNNPALFEYWHSHEGALLFVLLTVLLLGLFCGGMVRQTHRSSPKSGP